MQHLSVCARPQGKFYHTNFMTPVVLAYYELRVGHAELSEGRSIIPGGGMLYGVTVDPDPGRPGDTENPRLSRCFHSKRDALAHIRSLS